MVYAMKDTKSDILSFWFEETKPAQWFQKNAEFDEMILTRFEGDYDLAVKGIFDHWKNDEEGALALCILLDQFPRNMFRDTPKAFATDARALDVAKFAVGKGFDAILPVMQRRFLYLPFEHSESLQDQKTSVALFHSMKNEDPLGHDYAVKHYELIEKFGRFPHRNAILGRASTQQELEYLAQPDAGF
jgi:uncharacterized protein (DUF924 family)